MSDKETERVTKLVSEALEFMVTSGLVKTDADALLVAGVLGEVATQSFEAGANMGKETAIATMRNHPAGRH
jgi:hypothetical protein